MKTALLFLGSVAIVLGIFAFFAVFGNASGTYAVTANSAASGTGFNIPSSSVTFVTSSLSNASGTLGLSSSPTSTATSTNFYGSAYQMPALSWNDGGANFQITAAALQGTQLSFTLTIQIGSSPACVPLDIRLVADEEGDLQGPETPTFSFPDSSNCNGGAGETYTNQTVNFTVNPTNLPLLFTTGGPANIFFEVTTSTANGLNIDLPSTVD